MFNVTEQKSEPLPGGVLALALVAGVNIAATIIMTATTALHFPWPEFWFQALAVMFAAAVIAGHWLNFSQRRPAFALGVILGAMPSLVIAARHQIDHWDDFMTWLANALYLWKIGGFPTSAALPVASVWPGYPPGSSLVLAAVWSVAWRVVDTAGPVINVACLMILAGLVLRAVRARLPDDLIGNVVLGAMLGLAATILNVGLDWHWVLSSLPDTATSVAFAAAFILGAEVLSEETFSWRQSATALLALSAILALIVNLKQTGLVLVVLLLGALLVAKWTWDEAARRKLFRPLFLLALVSIPSAAVWLCWRIYQAKIFAGSSFSLHPLNEWHFPLLPDLLIAIMRSMAEHWIFFVPISLVFLRGWYVLVRRWIGRDRASISWADRLAAVFALVETGFAAFLFVCYLGAFAEDEVLRAAEWFRYQAQIGSAGLLTAIALVMERLPRPLPKATPAAILALQLVAVAVILPAPGWYPGRGVYGPAEVQELRRMGKKAGEAIAQNGVPVSLELIAKDYPLALLIVRYETWASAPLLIRDLKWVSGESLMERFAASMKQSSQALVAVTNENGIHCGVYAQGTRLELLTVESKAAACRPLFDSIAKLRKS